jgi:hypothetical protein
MPIRCVPLVLLLFLLLNTRQVGFAQRSGVEIVDRQIQSFQASSENISTVLEQFARQYKVPIGFEASTGAGAGSELKASRISVEKGTVKDALNSIVGAWPDYQWEQFGGVVNVFPRAHSDSLLNVVAAKFALENANKNDIVPALTQIPEVRRWSARTDLKLRNFSSLPGEPSEHLPRFSITIRNASIRTILNQTMKASSSYYWAYFRYGDHGKFFSLTM